MRKTRKQKGGWVVWTRRVKTCKKINAELMDKLKAITTELKKISSYNEIDKKFLDLYELITNKFLILIKEKMLDNLSFVYELILQWMFYKISEKDIINIILPPWVTDFRNILSDKCSKQANMYNGCTPVDIIVLLDELYNSVNKIELSDELSDNKLSRKYTQKDFYDKFYVHFKQKYSLNQSVDPDLSWDTDPKDLSYQTGGFLSPLSEYLQCIIEKEIQSEKIRTLTFLISVAREKIDWTRNKENDESTINHSLGGL